MTVGTSLTPALSFEPQVIKRGRLHEETRRAEPRAVRQLPVFALLVVVVTARPDVPRLMPSWMSG
jgi:hypothetical protein